MIWLIAAGLTAAAMLCFRLGQLTVWMYVLSVAAKLSVWLCVGAALLGGIYLGYQYITSRRGMVIA